MPASTLAEVTATIVGSMLASLVYVKFDFLETFMVPGMCLNEDALFRSFVVHAIIPIMACLLGVIHMLCLHKNKYSGAGGLKRLNWAPRFREIRRWRYTNRY